MNISAINPISNTACANPTQKEGKFSALANLQPSSFFSKKRIRSVKHSYQKKNPDVLLPEHQKLKDRVIIYFTSNNRLVLEEIQKEIFNILEGALCVDALHLTKDNCRSYLLHIKIIDQALAEYKIHTKLSTFELRTKILEVGSPSMTTCEAYTKTVDSRKCNDKIYLRNPANWMPERTGLYAKLFANQLILAAAYSRKINLDPPSITAIGGNTASGKSHSATEDTASGCLKADTFKYYLKISDPIKKNRFLINNQVHKEGSALFDTFRNSLIDQALNGHIVVEGRLSTLEEVEKTILASAIWYPKDVHLVYYMVPIEVSLIRVLTRDPYGKDPCPPLKDIVKGFKDSIQCCQELPQKLWQSNRTQTLIVNYTDHDGVRHSLSPEHYPLKQPTDEEIEKSLNKNMTNDYIDQAISKNWIPANARPLLEAWIGMPLGRAVQFHSEGISSTAAFQRMKQEALYLEKYGAVQCLPFNNAWLRDYPQVYEHIQTEQRLHIRGVDEQGQGLHWGTNKFAWNLNPAFNPEKGFQMKLGYFIIPPTHIEKLLSQSLSPKILKEIEHPKGCRFFVHPEAYEHFKVLHDANIPFVKPENSEYMGTPTSSYRSWVVRRLDNEESVPFIVKFGVLESSGSSGRLLPSTSIKKSLQFQQAFDSMDSPSFNKGGTGADFLLFKETLGMTLKNIPDYPPRGPCDVEAVDSGMIVREFPEDLLNGNCKIYSFSSLMSLERLKMENRGIGSLTSQKGSLAAFPLVYELINASMEQGLVKDPFEFMKKYFVQKLFDALEEVMFKAGFSLSIHGQNFCLVLNQDNTPRGFAYRDFEGIRSDGTGFLETVTWFGRYHLYFKLASVITLASEADIFDDHFVNATSQVGEKTRERSLYWYLMCHFHKRHDKEALQLLEKLSLVGRTDHMQLLRLYDLKFLYLLTKYFDIKKAGFAPDEHNSFPSAESGSPGEKQLMEMNQRLWHYKLK